ncbi:hypothetical protein WH52_00050 [Tenacibaculum holothuriorum]|uniref:Lipoprotein n=1 Tax=Tenacibaculum holothuriorum TaxID=1635173 RepID=A0A1Y2PG02_9FLAO|nr:DUF6452 family protein [Tenacibaculum holothuriorum]OSY89090.1 hypothetical protein WH52_00050 [Tenacibaculum holothuriorum]
MKKTFLITLIALTAILSSCEKDDFCTNSNPTPRLILTFYDYDNVSTIKKVDSLSVWAPGKDSIYRIQSQVDSIALPLNTTTNETVYNFSQGRLNTGTITIKYKAELDFVSRSCGFRYIFNNITLTKNVSWIDSLSTKEISVINNQTNAHVKIFH